MKAIATALALACLASTAGTDAVLEARVVKLDAAVRIISLFRGPNVPHSILAHELGGMKQVLDGPVTAIFKDATADSLHAYLLPKGFKHITDYDLDDVRPLVEAMINGRRKAFLYPSAGFFLQVPEMSMPLDRVSVPSSSLNDAFLERERDSPCPCVLVVDAESIRDDAAEDLDELGAFSMEREGLRIVRENHRHHPGSDHIEDHAVVAQA